MFDNLRKRMANFLHKEEKIPDKPPEGEEAWAVDGFFGANSAFAKWRGDDLKMRRGNGIYREMMLDDQVTAAIDLVNTAITGRRWRFKVDDGSQQEAADLFTFNMTRTLHGNITQLVNYMLWARVEGFSVVEKVYGSFAWEGKERWGLANYKLRPNDTITVSTDDHGNVLELLQDQGGVEKKLDPQRFIYSVHKSELDAHYGQSALRAAYEHYWAKLNIYKYWNIFMERMAGGFTIATVDGKLEIDQERNLRKVMENMQANTSITLPKGVTMEHHMPTDKGGFWDAIKSRNMSISRALLLPSLVGFGEETSTGSQARSQTQLEVWMMYLDSLASWIADTLNEQLFRELSFWNFGDIDPPLFEFESLSTEQKKQFAEQWLVAVESGAVKNTLEDEARLRDLLHFGERDPDAELVNEEQPSGEIPEGGELPRDQQPSLPDGSNPLDTATAGMRSAHEIEHKFEDRVDTSAIKKKLYETEADRFGEELFEAVDQNWLALLQDVRSGAPWDLSRVNQLSASDSTGVEDALRKGMLGAFEFGRTTAHEEVNDLRIEDGLDEVPLEDSGIENIKMSRMAKFELEAMGFALDLETAEQFLEVKLLELTGNVVNDRILSSTRLAIINGLRSELSIDEIVANAAEQLESTIGERDAKGNLITEATLPARLATLVRTSLTEAFNEGRRAFFEDPSLDGYVVAYQYSAVIDQRTTPFCFKANGRTWAVDNPLWRKYVPPNHFNCRSLMIPIVQGDKWKSSRDLPNDSDGEQIQPSLGFK